MFENKKIIITGGAGFLGSHLTALLKEKGVLGENIFIPRSNDYDLRKYEDVEKIFVKFPANIVIHLATTSGGMGYYKEHPGKVFYDNLLMGLNVIEVSRKNKVDKVIIVGSALGYPKNTPVPYSERNFWDGYPGELEAPYGIANKVLSVQLASYKKEYGLDGIYVILPNLYGPGDHFSEDAHVIPSMIKKFYDAEKNNDRQIILWGDGSASREFLFVRDAAEILIQAIMHYNSPDPLNLGPGQEINMRELANKIKEIIDYRGEIFWDATKPSGIPRRALDSSNSERIFNFIPKTNFNEGLNMTISDFEKSNLR